MFGFPVVRYISGAEYTVLSNQTLQVAGQSSFAKGENNVDFSLTLSSPRVRITTLTTALDSNLFYFIWTVLREYSCGSYIKGFGMQAIEWWSVGLLYYSERLRTAVNR